MPKQEIDSDQLFNLSLSIVGLVLKEGGATVEALASHFEVSEKTVVKAVRAIANSEDLDRYETHFYVDEDALEDGEVVFGLGQGLLTEPPSLSGSQQTAISMGLEYLASLPQFAGEPELLELRAQLGQGVVQNVASPADSLHLRYLEEARHAILSKQMVSFDYLSQLGKASRRLVDPLRIDLVGNKHYLRGYCHQSEGLRAFRVDRISGFSILERAISAQSLELEVPEAIFGETAGQEVTIAADSGAAEIFWNFPLAQPPAEEQGRLVGKILVGNLEAIARHVVRYGGKVEVLAPKQARDAVIRFARTALEFQTPEEE
ncbi:MAG: hypothetical protein RL068_237 [Actinomycetota bacterium]|jgi:proteasome accessory factor C